MAFWSHVYQEWNWIFSYLFPTLCFLLIIFPTVAILSLHVRCAVKSKRILRAGMVALHSRCKLPHGIPTPRIGVAGSSTSCCALPLQHPVTQHPARWTVMFQIRGCLPPRSRTWLETLTPCFGQVQSWHLWVMEEWTSGQEISVSLCLSGVTMSIK